MIKQFNKGINKMLKAKIKSLFDDHLEIIRDLDDAKEIIRERRRLEGLRFTSFGYEGSFHGYWNYQLNGNEPVGKVTVWYMPFSDMLRRTRELLKLYDLEGGYDMHQDAIDLAWDGLDPYIRWLDKEVLPERRNGKKLPRKATLWEFKSPLPEYIDEHGIVCRDVAEDAIEYGISLARQMHLDAEEDEDCIPVLKNVEQFCIMMISCARMCQELTIDAAKTGLKVIIPLAEALVSAKLNSRVDLPNGKEYAEPYGVSFHFGNGTEEDPDRLDLHCNPKGSFVVVDPKNAEKETYHFSDFFDEIRIDAMEIPKEYEPLVFERKQEIPEELFRYAEGVASRPRNLKYLNFIQLQMEEFRTLMGTERQEIGVQRRRLAAKHPDMFLSKVKGIKNDTKIAIAAMRSQVRSFLYYLTPEERAAIALYVSVTRKDAKSGRVSSFLGVVLEEEFMLLIMKFFEKEDIVARERLGRCDFKDGEVVTFRPIEISDGVMSTRAVDGYRVAWPEKVNAIPEGEYVIRIVDGKAYAESSMRDVLLSRIPEIKQNPDQLAIVTIGRPTAENALEPMLAAMATAKETVLMPYAVLADGTKFQNAIVCDGVTVGSFRTVVNTKEAKSGEESKEAAKARMTPDKTINGFFMNRMGHISFSRKLTYEVGKSQWEAAYVILDDLSRMSIVEFERWVKEATPDAVVAAAEIKEEPKEPKNAFSDLLGSDSEAIWDSVLGDLNEMAV